jgi:hypothetical protein
VHPAGKCIGRANTSSNWHTRTAIPAVTLERETNTHSTEMVGWPPPWGVRHKVCCCPSEGTAGCPLQQPYYRWRRLEFRVPKSVVRPLCTVLGSLQVSSTLCCLCSAAAGTAQAHSDEHNASRLLCWCSREWGIHITVIQRYYILLLCITFSARLF